MIKKHRKAVPRCIHGALLFVEGQVLTPPCTHFEILRREFWEIGGIIYSSSLINTPELAELLP